jgi:hypothetical protein
VSRSSLALGQYGTPPRWPDPDRDSRLRSGTELGRPDRGNPAGGRDLVFTIEAISRLTKLSYLCLMLLTPSK